MLKKIEYEEQGETKVRYIAKIIDFGLAKFFTLDEMCIKPTGTLAYCSPEIVLNRPHDKSTDLWSLGIMLYAAFAKRMPFLCHD